MLGRRRRRRTRVLRAGRRVHPGRGAHGEEGRAGGPGDRILLRKPDLLLPLSIAIDWGHTSNYVIADASEALVSVWRTSAAASWVFDNWALQPEEALHGRPTAGARTVNVGSVVDAVA